MKSVIHIGANKAASTTLQTSLFRGSPNLHYIGQEAVGFADYAHLIDSLINSDDSIYQPELLAQLLDRSQICSKKNVLLFSDEDVMTGRLPQICAARLKQLLPDAHILMIIRNQLTAIPSFYLNHGAFLSPAPAAHYRRHVEFDDWFGFNQQFSKYSVLPSFDYEFFEKIYSGLFPGRITILLFEEFISHREAFFEKICSVIGADISEALAHVGTTHARQRISQRHRLYGRFRSSFFWGRSLSRCLPFGDLLKERFEKFLAGGAPAELVLSSDATTEIKALYAAGNERLSQEYNLPLSHFGYPTLNPGGA